MIHTSDPVAVRDVSAHLLSPHALEPVDPQAKLDARVHCRRFSDTALFFVTYGSEVVVSITEPPGTFFAFAMPLTGTTGFRYHDTHLLLTGKLGVAVSSTDDDIEMYWESDCAFLLFRVEQPALEAHLSGLLGQHLTQPLRFESAMPLNRDGGNIINTRIRALVSDLDDGTRIYDHPPMTSAFEQSMMTEILFSQRHNYSARLEGDVKAAGSRDVERALMLIESHPEWPLSSASVARDLSISTRSLERRILHDFDTTFIELLRKSRMQRAHDDLLSTGPDTTKVTDVLTRWCLIPDGRTYADYRKIHSETPAQTLRRQP